jgi:transposase
MFMELDMAIFRTPPYSPHLIPIEDAFTQVKAYLKRHEARAIRHPKELILEALQSVTPAQARNFFRHAKYNVDEE